ncbi:hypothetical protein [Halomonas sp. JS92-SW72]|uniref:hypothetical protein n=1 Tax=Halomonas sp. JS92-SW72 TaxID=2306583 RepID=UPI000E5BEEB6|nr:hypothetical protein [Halomonas sp. JS92-SW72]AXY41599.1 hypothetical protein D1793_04965 [Halomonas sp. JS92-SW72]
MSTKPHTTKTPAPRREVDLAKPIIQGGREFKPGDKEKPRLTEAQIARLTKSGHVSASAKGVAKASASTPQEG